MNTNLNEKIHYYGWYNISNQIKENFSSNKIIIIDYVDTYFLSNNKIIDKNWGGVIHHTSSNYSNINIINLFNNKIFIESLKYCKFLISLSEYNKINITNELTKLKLDIKVHVLKHPSPPTFYKTFNVNIFKKTLNIYNIGAYMRNAYTIYRSNFYYNDILLNKHKLKGMLMDNYFPEKDINFVNIVNDTNNYKSINLQNENLTINVKNNEKFHINSHSELIKEIENTKYIFGKNNENLYIKLCTELINCNNEIVKEDIKNQLSNLDLQNNIIISTPQNEVQYSRCNSDFNYYNYYAFKYIEQFTNKSKTQLNKLLVNNNKSVTVHEYLENSEYLNILTNNIIFCDYIDCSASNTIVECIATHTPIIVNRLPAVVEYLGEDYPLYFDKIYNSETDSFHLTDQNLSDTYNHFIKMKKDNHIDIFINKLQGIVNSSISRNKNRIHYYNYKK